jgi:ferritin-like metal-binding protein YciE
MASTATLRDHLIDELNDLLDAEEQLIEALPGMAQKATDRQRSKSSSRSRGKRRSRSTR